MDSKRKLAIARFDGPSDNIPRSRFVTWERLSKLLTRHIERENKEGELWSPALYPDGSKRRKENVEAMSCFVMDIDDGCNPDDLEQYWSRWVYAIASTHSHTPEHPKWRVIFPLAYDIPAEDWPRVWDKLGVHLGGKRLDVKCKDQSRIYYLPSCPPDAERFGYVVDNGRPWLDPVEYEDVEVSPDEPAQEPDQEGEPMAPRRPRKKGKGLITEEPVYDREEGDDRPPTALLLDRALDRAGSEGRNNAGMWLCCQLRDNGYSRSEAEPVVLDYQSRVPSHGRDRYTESEALATLKSAFRAPARGKWEKQQREERRPPNRTENLPCHVELLNLRSEVSIPFDQRYEVLHAIVGHYLRKSPKPDQGEVERQVYSINLERCTPPLPKAEVLDLVERSFGSAASGTFCEIIQKANLCPVIEAGGYCSVFAEKEAKREQIREQLAEDPDTLTLTPVHILRTAPVQYTVTVKGRELELTPEQLANFRLFKLRCMTELSFIPELPYIKGVSGKGVPPGVVWDYIVNEALKSAIEHEAPPEDASPRGIVWARIVEFCTQRVKVCTSTEDRLRLRTKLAIYDYKDGQPFYMFRGPDLAEELAARRCTELTMSLVWKLVKDKGGINCTIAMPTGKGSERVWALPAKVVGEPVGIGESMPMRTDRAPMGIADGEG